MKFLFSRQNLVLALSAGLLLAACGGGKATFDVKGELRDVKYEGLILTNVKNGDKLTVAAGATTFKMGKTIEYGEEYDVQILTGNSPLHQNCQVFNGKDTAGRLASINIGVQCFLNQVPLTGTVKDLTADGLTLTNGSDEQIVVPKGATSFAFSALPFGTTYGITILKPATGLICTVSNGVGTMGDASPTNIEIKCIG